MARSIRGVYRSMQGRVRMNVNWDAINVNTSVVVTAAEWSAAGGIFGSLVGRPLLGDANVYVTNVGPHGSGTEAGGVEFILHVDWPSPLPIVVDITAFDEFEDTFAGN